MPKLLTANDIDNIAKVYARTVSLSATARETGFHFLTVKRWVEVGDPQRGIPSIKSQMAKQIMRKGIAGHTLQKRLNYTVADAFESSTNVFRLVKGLFNSKFAGLLKELDDAIKSGDQARIAHAKAKAEKEVKISDVARIAVAEAIVFEKLMPGKGTEDPNTPTMQQLPPDTAEEVDDLLRIFQQHGIAVDDPEDPGPDEQEEEDTTEEGEDNEGNGASS